jgi:hypothetical protein
MEKKQCLQMMQSPESGQASSLRAFCVKDDSIVIDAMIEKKLEEVRSAPQAYAAP